MLIMFMMADSLRLTGSRSLYVHLVPIIAMVLTTGEPQMGRLVGPVIISQVSFCHLFLGTMSEEDERLRYCCCVLAERGIFHVLLVPQEFTQEGWAGILETGWCQSPTLSWPDPFTFLIFSTDI